MTAAAYVAYGVTFGILVLNGWYLIEARHAARIARIDANACERQYELTKQIIDDFMSVRHKMDAQLFQQLHQLAGSDRPTKVTKPD